MFAIVAVDADIADAANGGLTFKHHLGEIGGARKAGFFDDARKGAALLAIEVPGERFLGLGS
jgi:hypothetical protein